MKQSNIKTQIEATPETMGTLEAIVREGARKMLQAALEAEIEEHLSRFKNLVDKDGKRVVVRNGVMPERTVLTGAGPLPVRRPRVDDRVLLHEPYPPEVHAAGTKYRHPRASAVPQGHLD